MKTKLVLGLVACLLLMCSLAKSQEVDTILKNKYERETLMLEGNNDKYCKNKVWKRVGLFKPRIEQEFYSCSFESKKEISKFREGRRRGTALLIAGGAVFVAAVVIAPVITLPVFAATFGTGLTIYFVGSGSLQKSRKHLHKAVWLHNRDVMANH